MKLRLGPEDRVLVDGVACEVVRSTRTGHVLRTVGSLREREEISDEAFTYGHASGSIEILRDAFAITSASVGRPPPVANLLADLTEEKSAETLFRLAYVERFTELWEVGEAVRTDAGYGRAVARIHEERRLEALAAAKATSGRAPRGGRLSSERTCPSGAQLRRWCETHAVSGAIGLSPRTDRCGNRSDRFHPVVAEFFRRSLSAFCSKNAPTGVETHRRLARMVRLWNVQHGTDLRAPSYSTVCTRIEKLPVVDVEVGRGSLASARRRLAISRGGLAPRLLLERVEMDEWEVGLQTLLVEAKVWKILPKDLRMEWAPLRCYLTAALCCTSNCVVALHLTLDAPSTRTAVAGLRQILVDKSDMARAAGAETPWAFYGTPTTLGTDKGTAFSSNVFKRIVADLRCSKPKPPAGLPHLRGTIERFFGTLDRGLLQFFTGRTFANVVARGDYDAQAAASLTVEALRTAVIRYVCDVYHRRPQKELGNICPAQAWDREMLRTRVLPPPGPAAMRDIFGTHFTRSVDKKGVLFAGTHYHSSWLNDFWLTNGDGPVDIRVDRHALSAISVRTGPAQWVSVNAVGGQRFSAADALAALKIAAAQDPSPFDDEAENLRVMDRALDDLEDLGEAARIEAGVPDPVAAPAEFERLRASFHRLWVAYDAKRDSRALDHLNGILAPSQAPDSDAEVSADRTPDKPSIAPTSPPVEHARDRTAADGTVRGKRDPRKPRFEIRS